MDTAENRSPEDLAAQAALANLGEIVGPVLHEFNNFLNTVSLLMAVAEVQAPQGLEAEWLAIRKQAMAMAALVRRVQQYRRGPGAAPQPVDLNQIVAAAVEELRRQRPIVAVQVTLAAALPPVPGSALDLQRLCTFLLKNAAAAVATMSGNQDGGIFVRTERQAERVLLYVEDAGPSVAAESLRHLFEPSWLGREGTESLEMAACQALVKHLQGKIRGEERTGGGLVVRVELPGSHSGR